jgi:transcriptional regulator with XRE-family HTH domain
MKLGDKIRHIRELKELKQEYVARQLNLSVTAYGNIERNETDITFRRLEEIAHILAISSITILGFPDFASIDMQASDPGNAWQA